MRRSICILNGNKYVFDNVDRISTRHWSAIFAWSYSRFVRMEIRLKVSYSQASPLCEYKRDIAKWYWRKTQTLVPFRKLSIRFCSNQRFDFSHFAIKPAWPRKQIGKRVVCLCPDGNPHNKAARKFIRMRAVCIDVTLYSRIFVTISCCALTSIVIYKMGKKSQTSEISRKEWNIEKKC